MKNDDPEFESFLKNFRPRAPRPLPDAPKPVWWRPAFAMAALILLACGIWLARRSSLHTAETVTKARVEDRKSRMVSPMATLGTLQRAANADPQRFNAMLDAQAAALLPDVTRRNGALRVLAKE